MPVVRRLVRMFRPYRGLVLLALLSMAGVSLATGGVVFMAKSIFDDALTAEGSAVSPNAGEGGLLPGGDTSFSAGKTNAVRWAERRYSDLKLALGVNRDNKHLIIPLLLALVFFVKGLFSYCAEYAYNRVGLSLVRDLRNQLYERVILQSSRFFEERPTGELISRIVSDVEMVQNAISSRLGDLFQETLTLAVLIAYVVSLNSKLALLSLLVAPVVVYPVVVFGKRLRKTTHRVQERMAELATVLDESIKGNKIVKAFAMEDFEIGRFRRASGKHFDVSLKARKIAALSSPIMESIGMVCGFGLFAYASYQIGHGSMSLGDFASFMTGLYLMYSPVKKLNKVNLALQQALSAAQRVFSMVDLPNEIADAPGASPLAPFRERLEFRAVRFSYGGSDGKNAEVLRGLDLVVDRGKVCAIVGSSGAGKSTLVSLVPRFYDVTGGAVLLDGVDLRKVTLQSLRDQIGVVTQEVILFNDTVRGNIAYGRAAIGTAAVEAAARSAYAHDFIEKLPRGYDTEIGEAGVRLSGGQRQRLAIARALLKDPPILILDEATSALDAESEVLVQRALYELMKGRTTLVIAHRLSTIRRADTIALLDRGRIVELGTHEELLARDRLYKRLFDMQFHAHVPDPEEPVTARQEGVR